MDHYLRVTTTLTVSRIQFAHSALCGADAMCLVTDKRLCDCPKCKERMEGKV